MKEPREILRNSAVVILLTAGATAFRYIFNPTLGFRAPMLFHVLAVSIASQIAGTMAGLFTTAMSALLIAYFFVSPVHTFGLGADPGDHLAILLFIAVGIALSIFGGRRKRAEDELRRIHYNLETAQHIANIGSWESDLVRRLWWSPATYRTFGIEPGTRLEIRDFYDLVHPDDRAAVREAVQKAIQTGADYEVRHRIVRRTDGEVRWVHQQAKVVEEGTAHLIGSIKDITEERQGELAQQILGGLLQVCSACRRVRDVQEKEEWFSMEAYLRAHTAARFSHGMCPDCSKQWSG